MHEAVVGSAQRVIVARAWAPRNAAVQLCLEYLGSSHPEFELKGSARAVVQFEGVLPEAETCVAYATIDLDGQAAVMVDVPPDVYELVRLVLTWPAASTLNMVMASGIRFVHKHMISVFASDTVRLDAAHTTMITPSSS